MSAIQLFDLNGEQRFTGTSVGGGGSLPAWLQSGSGSPVDSVTPAQTGAVYFDTAHGTLYLAVGATNAEWLVVGRVTGNIGEATGLTWLDNNRDIYLLSGERNSFASSVYIGSTYAQWNGNGQGLKMSYAEGPIGQLSVTIEAVTGSSGQHSATLQDSNGTLSLADGGIKFPSADPHIAGCWWDNAGTLTRSAG